MKDFLHANRHSARSAQRSEPVRESVAPALRRGAVADREQDLETLFSVSPTGLLLVGNQNFSILRANQKAADLIGVPAGQLANVDLRTYLDVDYEANQHFLDKLGKSMASQRRKGGRLTVGFVDLDGLKVANDNFGHAEGDWLIRTLAQVLIGVTRSSDAAVRLGGDEFLLILPDCSLDEADQLLARGERRLQETSTAEHKSFPVGFSYGLASYVPEKHATPDDLIAEADRLMYQAKQEKQRRRADR